MPIEIKSTVDLTEMLKRFSGIQQGLPQAIHRAVVNSIQAMSAYLVRDRLSHRGPDTLGVVTGTARRSIASGVEGIVPTGGVVRGYFGSPLRYVRAHDQGFAGTVRKRAHSRRTKKGGVAAVRAHDVRMNIRARRFFKKTIEVGQPGVERRVRTALRVLAVTGKVPTFSDIESGGE